VHFVDTHWHQQHGRLVLQDELDLTQPRLPAKATERAQTPVGLHALVAIAYRRLINNFEKVRDYDLAEDCFVGAMEMKRLDPDHFLFARWLRPHYARWRWLRWLGAHLSAVNLYRWASYYGSSYVRAFEVLLFLLFAFAAAFALAGLQPRQPPAPPLAPPLVGLAGPAVVPYPSAWVAASKAYLAGCLHSLQVATFQRTTFYLPTNPAMAGLLAGLEALLVPAQLAVLLLALRRRFRR